MAYISGNPQVTLPNVQQQQGGYLGGYQPAALPAAPPNPFAEVLGKFGSGLEKGFEKGLQKNIQRQSIAKLKEMMASNPSMSPMDQLAAIAELPEELQDYAAKTFEQQAKYGPIATPNQMAADQALQQGLFGGKSQQPMPQQGAMGAGQSGQKQVGQASQPQTDQTAQEPQTQAAESPEIQEIDSEIAQIENAYASLSPQGREEARKRRSALLDAKRAAQTRNFELGIQANKEFREEMNKDYENYNFKNRVLNQMSNLNETEDLSSPQMQTLLEQLNLPTGWINNPSAEEFEKLSQQLMNDIQSTYGSRLNQLEVQNYMKQIPTLMNTKEGRKRVIKDLQNLNEARKIKYQTYQKISKNGTYLPVNLREMVTDQSQKRLQKAENELLESVQYFKPLTMYKNGTEYQIPANQVQNALNNDYTLKSPSQGKANMATAGVSAPEWFMRKQGGK